MSDNEHTPPPLGNGVREAVHSDKLSVQHSVGPPIPEFPQPCEEGRKSPSSVNRQDAGDILPEKPLGAIVINQREIGKGEVAARVIQSLTESGDTEGLARCSAAKKVN